ncbi:MAG: DUF5777 family beta-barrel protein [Myxococcota bacterium]
MLPAALLSAALLSPTWMATHTAPPALEDRVVEIFEASCTACHDEDNPGSAEGIDLGAPQTLINRASVDAPDRILVVPGDPDASYLLTKMVGGDMQGELMPIGDDPLPSEQLTAVRNWIASMPGGPATPTGPTTTSPTGPTTTKITAAPPKKKKPKPFHGTHQVVLPTTATLGKRTLQYRIDHRFGRIGTERGAFGLDAGVSMAMHLQYGIFDGWDVLLRRANSRKTWELGTKYIPVRQENGAGVSFGGYAALSVLRDFDVSNRVSGDGILMLSRLWFDRWSTMLTAGYHLRTNHNGRVTIDFDDGNGPVLAKDTRDTVTVGFASTVWLGKKRRWGIDMEWIVPIPDGSHPNALYYRGGDTDPNGSTIGAWSLGGSYATNKHFFQVFFTNNREIATNLAAPGGQSGNPFRTEGVESNNPFHQANFFLGFNLARRFTMGKRIDALKKKRAEEAESRKGRRRR